MKAQATVKPDSGYRFRVLPLLLITILQFAAVSLHFHHAEHAGSEFAHPRAEQGHFAHDSDGHENGHTAIVLSCEQCFLLSFVSAMATGTAHPTGSSGHSEYLFASPDRTFTAAFAGYQSRAPPTSV